MASIRERCVYARAHGPSGGQMVVRVLGGLVVGAFVLLALSVFGSSGAASDELIARVAVAAGLVVVVVGESAYHFLKADSALREIRHRRIQDRQSEVYKRALAKAREPLPKPTLASGIVARIDMGIGEAGAPTAVVTSAVETEEMRAKITRFAGRGRAIREAQGLVVLLWGSGEERERFAVGDAAILRLGTVTVMPQEKARLTVGRERRIEISGCRSEHYENSSLFWLEIEFTAIGSASPERRWIQLAVDVEGDDIIGLSWGEREP